MRREELLLRWCHGIWGGKDLTGEFSGQRQDSVLLEKWVPRGEPSWAFWRTGPLPYQGKQMTNLTRHSLGAVVPAYLLHDFLVERCTFLPFDFRVGQVICLGQWEVCRWIVSPDLKYTREMRLAILCSYFCHGKDTPQESALPVKTRNMGELKTQPTGWNQAQPHSVSITSQIPVNS